MVVNNGLLVNFGSVSLPLSGPNTGKNANIVYPILFETVLLVTDGWYCDGNQYVVSHARQNDTKSGHTIAYWNNHSVNSNGFIYSYLAIGI